MYSPWHCRRSWFHRSIPHVSTFLRPFAPPALPGFLATMDALTPAGWVDLGGAAVFRSCRSRRRPQAWSVWVWPNRRHLCPQDPSRNPGQVSLLHVNEPSDHSVSNHHLPFRSGIVWRDPNGPTPSGLRHSLASSPKQPAESSSPKLRTGHSPAVALHPLSRGRSYHRLQSPRRTLARTFTSLVRCARRRTSAARIAALVFSILLHPAFLKTLSGRAVGPSPPEQSRRIAPQCL